MKKTFFILLFIISFSLYSYNKYSLPYFPSTHQEIKSNLYLNSIGFDNPSNIKTITFTTIKDIDLHSKPKIVFISSSGITVLSKNNFTIFIPFSTIIKFETKTVQ